MDVTEQAHDSRHVAMADRRFDARIVSLTQADDKTSFET
jgi:hypothetical protein